MINAFTDLGHVQTRQIPPARRSHHVALFQNLPPTRRQPFYTVAQIHNRR